MFFVKQFNVRGRQAKYKFASKSDRGIILHALKWEPDPEYEGIIFAKAELESAGITVAGWDDYFIVRNHCVFEKYGLENPVPIEAGTAFIDNQKMRLIPPERPEVEVVVSGASFALTYDEWRVLRFEIDEMFLLQGRIPE